MTKRETIKGQSTAEQQKPRREAADEVVKWRTSVSMDKYKAFRKMYVDEGVNTYCFKLPPTMEICDAEYEYIWNVAETLGAKHITMELPPNDKRLLRVADYAAKCKLEIPFHTQGKCGDSKFPSSAGEKIGGGANMPWGRGETPLKEILQLMKKNRYTVPGSIEYAYDTPEGSDVIIEVKKCVQCCENALA